MSNTFSFNLSCKHFWFTSIQVVSCAKTFICVKLKLSSLSFLPFLKMIASIPFTKNTPCDNYSNACPSLVFLLSLVPFFIKFKKNETSKVLHRLIMVNINNSYTNVSTFHSKQANTNWSNVFNLN